MPNSRKIYGLELTAILLLWALVIISPLFFVDDFHTDWRMVHVMWAECIVVGVAFLVNRFVLMPRLFFAKRYVAYSLSLVALMLLLSLIILYFDGVNLIVSLWEDEGVVSTMAMTMHNTPPPPHGGFSPHVAPPSVSVIPPTISVLIVSTIVIALDLGLRIAIMWIIAEQRQATINREQLASHLQNLQSQVSPHFFMNTLNNIHALVDIDSQRAKRTIIELSDLMSYLLYDCSNKESVLLHREMEFVTSYVNLMRLRFSEQVNVKLSYGSDVPSVKIPPLLFLNFIENAFKYGVDYERESSIKIRFSFSEEAIEMMIRNTNHSDTLGRDGRGHGLGISNSRKRLDLIYGDRYILDITETESLYFVTLKIPIL